MNDPQRKSEVASLIAALMAFMPSMTNDPLVAISGLASCLVTMLMILARVGGMHVTHEAIDKIVFNLNAMRQAKSPDEMATIMSTSVDGRVDCRGEIFNEPTQQ